MNILPCKVPLFIENDKIPIIIPFAPKGGGKTMMLRRLFEYLVAQGYIVRVNYSCVPNNLLSIYKRHADQFIKGMFSCEVPTTQRTPLLFDLYNHNENQIFYILDQEGDCYFDDYIYPENVFLAEILNCPNKKIWLFMLEPPFFRSNMVKYYIRRIIDMKAVIAPDDKVIFVATKADHFSMNKYGNCDVKEIRDLYHELFYAFKSTNPIINLFRGIFRFVVFSAGYFTNDHYVRGEDKYPSILWKTILRHI